MKPQPCVWLFLILSFTSAWGWAQTPDPTEVVRKYCEGDAQGARLVNHGHPEFWALMDPTAVWAAPGWDTVTVISACTVGAPRIRGTTAEVPVVFHQLGSFSDRFAAHHESVTVNFSLINRADGWKIRDPHLPPHVYVRTLQDHFLTMRWWLNGVEERDRVRKILYQVFRAILFEKTVAHYIDRVLSSDN